MTKRAVTSKALRLFRKANPDAGTVTLTWTHGPVLGAFPTGVRGWSGVATAAAPGYRTRTVVMTADPDGTGMRVG